MTRNPFSGRSLAPCVEGCRWRRTSPPCDDARNAAQTLSGKSMTVSRESLQLHALHAARTAAVAPSRRRRPRASPRVRARSDDFGPSSSWRLFIACASARACRARSGAECGACGVGRRGTSASRVAAKAFGNNAFLRLCHAGRTRCASRARRGVAADYATREVRRGPAATLAVRLSLPTKWTHCPSTTPRSL